MDETDIEALIQPLIDRQTQINDYVVDYIARRIKEIGTVTPSDIKKIERLYQSGVDIRTINKELARLAGMQVSEIKKIINQVALVSYQGTKPFYEIANKTFIPLKDNKPLQNIIKAVAKQTSDTFVNLSKAQAFMIRDLKNPKILKPTPIAKTYQSIIDEAVQAAQSGTIDYKTAMRRSLSQMIDSGIRSVTYNTETGRVFTQRLDTAVRRNILDGIRAINQGVQDETGKQFGADGKEITVHRYSAPDHEPVQGHQFTNEEFEKLQNHQNFEDVDGEKFKGFPRSIGVWNCRHFTYSIIIGHAKPNYTKEQLEAFKEENQKGYTLPNGKHLTMYECTQKQRDYELKIRRAGEAKRSAEEAGDTELAEKYKAKRIKLMNEYKEFSKACGLSVKMEKTQIITK